MTEFVHQLIRVRVMAFVSVPHQPCGQIWAYRGIKSGFDVPADNTFGVLGREPATLGRSTPSSGVTPVGQVRRVPVETPRRTVCQFWQIRACRCSMAWNGARRQPRCSATFTWCNIVWFSACSHKGELMSKFLRDRTYLLSVQDATRQMPPLESPFRVAPSISTQSKTGEIGTHAPSLTTSFFFLLSLFCLISLFLFPATSSAHRSTVVA